MTHRVPIEDAIDLHAFAPRDVKSVVEEYVTAAHEAGFREVLWMTDQDEVMRAALAKPDPLGEPDPSEDALDSTLLNGPDGPPPVERTTAPCAGSI